MCLIFTLATYIKTNPLRKIKADVEKLFGRIKAQITNNGNKM